MNFVAHAHIARDHGDDPRFVLGSMLPDFASMSRARLVAPTQPELGAGVALHHRTDDAFHVTPEFVRLCTTWSEALDARGLTWGASRAVAHVGTEMLLDGVLLDDAQTRAVYLDAVATLGDPLVVGALRVEGLGRERWPSVLERVRTHGVPDFYRDPESVADRLIQILAGRPRLAIEEAHRATLREAMRALQRDVVSCAATLVADTRDALTQRR